VGIGRGVGITYANIDHSSPDAAATTAPVANAPTRFDPLVQYASYDWLPSDKLTWRTTSINAARFTVNAAEYVPDPANGPNAAKPAAFVGVSLYAAGVDPLTELPFQTMSGDGTTQTMHYGPVTDAPPVDGAPAYWVGVPGDTETVILKWRYAPDGWAELSASRLGGDLRETIHRIASALRVGGTERLRFPFQLTGLPAGLRPASSEFEEGGLTSPWHATLDLDTQPGSQPDGKAPSVVSVSVNPSTDQSGSRNSNTTVDGHQARRDIVSGDHLGEPQYSDRLSVYGLDGLQADVSISTATAEDAAPLGPDGALGLYRTLTVHPDRADWTDQPVR
jgi:hypothetical protein